MKKLFLFSFAIMSSVFASAQCTDLFISEYVEGTFNNKALGIYNPTNAAIDMSNYQLHRWANGETVIDTTHVIRLGGMIAPHQEYVIVIDKRDTTLTGQDTAAFAALIAMGDTFLCIDYNINSVMYFNGDDAVALETYPGAMLVDLIGKIGERPTNGSGTFSPTGGWTNVSPFATGLGPYYTKDKTLIRKPTSMAGVTSNPSLYDPSMEWDTLSVNTFTNLGIHNCNCPVGIDEVGELRTILFPNPASNSVMISSSEKMEAVFVYDLLGREILSATPNDFETEINIYSLAKGMYSVRIISVSKKNFNGTLSVE